MITCRSELHVHTHTHTYAWFYVSSVEQGSELFRPLAVPTLQIFFLDSQAVITQNEGPQNNITIYIFPFLFALFFAFYILFYANKNWTRV